MQAQIVQILNAADYPQEIQRAAELLAAGKLVVLPTETVYGVAGVLTNAEVRSSLAQIRGSASPKPFTIHLARPGDAVQYLAEANDFARRVIHKLWPGPVGLVFDVAESRRREVASELGVEPGDLYDGASITLRCPDHPVFVDVVGKVKEPVVLSSSGQVVQRAGDLAEEMLSQVEMVCDAGPTRFSKPSTLVRVKENSYEIVRGGVYDERIIDRLLRTTILFVCSGNTCRSPMAEAIARRYLAERLSVAPEELEKKGISVTSAGSFAMPGARAAAPAVETMRAMGLDLSRHRSRALSVELIHQADVIYAMSQSHAKAVASLVPGAADKVSNLDPNGDIEDPIGGEVSLYIAVAERIKKLIEQRLAQGIVP
ncbi:MAG: Sua5/YciO/YrdC/YwlC family protein [Tepidisphaeraceae bacterium]|jgi:protein-tyrosine phosphatase